MRHTYRRPLAICAAAVTCALTGCATDSPSESAATIPASMRSPGTTTVTYVDHTGSTPQNAHVKWSAPTLSPNLADREPAEPGFAYVSVTVDAELPATDQPAPSDWARFVDQDGDIYPVWHVEDWRTSGNGIDGDWVALVPDTTTSGRFVFELDTLTYARPRGGLIDLTGSQFEVRVVFLGPPETTTVTYVVDPDRRFYETARPPETVAVRWAAPTLSPTHAYREPAAPGFTYVSVSVDADLSGPAAQPAPGDWARFVDQDDVSYPVAHDGWDGIDGDWIALVPDTTTSGRFVFELGTLHVWRCLADRFDICDDVPFDFTGSQFEVLVAFPPAR